MRNLLLSGYENAEEIERFVFEHNENFPKDKLADIPINLVN